MAETSDHPLGGSLPASRKYEIPCKVDLKRDLLQDTDVDDSVACLICLQFRIKGNLVMI